MSGPSEELLARMRPFIEILAAERTRESSEYDDAVQEGLIAVWQASLAKPEAHQHYLNAAAKYGVIRHLRGRPPFGTKGHQGWQDALTEAAAFPDDFDAIAEEIEEEFEALLWRISADEVREAVGRLDDESHEIVDLRFWKDMTWPMAARTLGRRSEAVRRQFRDHIAPPLAEELQHLRPLVA